MRRVEVFIKSKWMALLLSFVSTWAVCLEGHVPYRSFLFPVLMGMLFVIYLGQLREGLLSMKGKVPLVALSMTLSMIAVLVNHREYTEGVSSTAMKLCVLLVVFTGLYSLLLLCASYLASGTVSRMISGGIASKVEWKRNSKLHRYEQLYVFFGCILCWLPYYLQNYPGIMTPDSIVQMEQVMGVAPWSNHHPVFHTAILAVFTKIGFLLTDDINIAVSVYTTVQMIFMAYCASACIRTLKSMKVCFWIRVMATAFFALIPFNAIFSVTIWKDVPFGGVCLLLVCVLMELIAMIGSHKNIPVSVWVRFTGICILFCLLRNNGWYAFILLIPCLLPAFRKQIKPAGVSILIAVSVCLCVKGPLYSALNIIESEFIVSCNIPLQQICRVVATGKTVTPEQYEQINRVVEIDRIPDEYLGWLSNPMVNLAREGDVTYLEEHKGDYLKLWLELGLQYPRTYLEAWVAQTFGYYYPEVDLEYWVFGAGVQENNLGLESRSLFPEHLQLKIGGELFVIAYYRFLVPVYAILWSIGIYTWMLLSNIALILQQRRCFERIIVLMVPLALVCTLLIATPVAYEFRYAYGIIFSMPAWLLLPWMDAFKKDLIMN